MHTLWILGAGLWLAGAAWAADWKLVWADEFDQDGLPDPAKWSYEEGFVRNRELQYYTAGRTQNARVEGQAGVLGPDPALVARGRRRLRGYGVLSRKGASQFVVAPQWMKFVRNGKAPGTCAKSKSSTAQAASVPAMP
ncbi:Beta-glucanase [Anaerolineae bacterium]|nr:Beta-glucanase [Anaerolineae bacterium]